jgi:ribonuclease T1
MRGLTGRLGVGLLWVALLLGFAAGQAQAPAAGPLPEVALSELPRQAQEALALIQRGGPFPYRKDGSVFGNFERRLPIRERGYYREYTVPTPGSRDRGARRLVVGRGGEFYYTDDHYRTFRRIRE